jgi:hypothetical protein
LDALSMSSGHDPLARILPAHVAATHPDILSRLRKPDAVILWNQMDEDLIESKWFAASRVVIVVTLPA